MRALAIRQDRRQFCQRNLATLFLDLPSLLFVYFVFDSSFPLPTSLYYAHCAFADTHLIIPCRAQRRNDNNACRRIKILYNFVLHRSHCVILLSFPSSGKQAFRMKIPETLV